MFFYRGLPELFDLEVATGRVVQTSHIANMPAYPVQKKRKLSNDATDRTVLHKKKSAKPTKAAAPPKKVQEEPVDQDSGSASDDGQEQVEEGEDVAEEEAEAEKTFADLGLTESLCDACATLGFKKPTPIQRESLPVALTSWNWKQC